MSRKDSDEVRLTLERIWLNSRNEAMSRLTTLERFVENLRAGAVNEHSLETAISAAHRLSGSLGMFGFNEASSCAAEIEAMLAHDLKGVAPMVSLLKHLRDLLEGTPASKENSEKRAS